MALVRNPNNEIGFNTQFMGASIFVYEISGAAGIDLETSPGEDMEKLVEKIQDRSNIVAIGAESGGTFKIYLENNGWTDTLLQTELRTIGGTLTSCVVSDSSF